MGELARLRGTESGWRHRNNGEGIGYNGKWCRKDSAMSDACRKSKQLETRSLAADKSSQQELDRRTKCNIPESSQLPSNHPRGPTEPINPPRRRGRLKSLTRKINTLHYSFLHRVQLANKNLYITHKKKCVPAPTIMAHTGPLLLLQFNMPRA